VRKDFEVVSGGKRPLEGEQTPEKPSEKSADPTPAFETADRVIAPDIALQTFPHMNGAQIMIAIAAALAILYFGKLPIVVLLASALIAFMMEPLVGAFERWMPRVLAAGLAMALVVGAVYAASYYSYLQAKDFAAEFPKYSGQIKQQVIRFRQQASKIDETRKAIIPESAEEKNTVRVKPVESSFPTAESNLTETVVAISFVPFLVFFMLTWQEHIRASLVQLFRREDRTTAYVAFSHISRMLRAFIAGNFIIGLLVGIASAALFWYFNIPYWYFVGLISGFVSLVPYLGVPLAIAPPLIAGIAVLHPSEMFAVAIGVVSFHLIALNVLYPKLLGSRLQLNPLAVTVSLLVWGFLWGAVGLVLAIPITAALKIVFEHIASLQPLSHLLGEGESSG
jgi:predicted PurR-regulated permease PerM